jgi:acyl dehydratase
MVESPIGVAGTKSETTVREWEARDTLLYAVGVGAGAIDPVGFELAFTTENSKDVPQRVFPTFASLLGPNLKGVVDWSQVDRSKLVHGEQTIILSSPLPAAGSASVTTNLLGVLDKGSGCLVVVETVGADATSGESLFRARMGLFIRGGGGFGGPKELDVDGESAFACQPMPSRPPEHVVTYETRTDQALLYRLSGDRNPLHSDPSFAARAGFSKPILHGLCTYGFTGRALLHTLCDSNPSRFGSMHARFSKPVFPGDSLTVSVWDESDRQAGGYRFRTSTQNGDVVLDGGVFQLLNQQSSS